MNQRTTTDTARGRWTTKMKGRWTQGGGRWGAREAPKTPRERRPPSTHSCHLRGALIGPSQLVGMGAAQKAPKQARERDPPGAHSRQLAVALIGPCEVGGNGGPKTTQNRGGKATPRVPIAINRRGLDWPPRFTGMSTQKTPKVEWERHPLGAHFPQPRGALIGPRGWWQWAPKSRPKRR